jgi:hypothetical protein
MICEYGCDKEANYQFKNGKWCCSNYSSQCWSHREKMSQKYTGKNNPMYGKIQTEKTILKIIRSKENLNLSEIIKSTYTNDLIKKRRIKALELWGDKNFRNKIILSITKSWKRQNIINKHKRTIENINEKYPLFSKIEDMRYNPDKLEEKEIQVHCKNHTCKNSKEKNGWFTPKNRQIEARIMAIENHSKDNNYFYCSQKCKDICPLYNSKGGDPFKSENEYIKEYQTFRKFVLDRDNYICQFCGDKATEVHHERPQKVEPFFSLDPDYAWSCCKKCHYEKGHKDKCSTGNLAKIKCRDNYSLTATGA